MPNVLMPYLSPQTLTKAEQDALLSATTGRDHLIFSLALGTGLRLAELVGLNVGDVYLDGTPRQRIRLRREIAKGGRASDVFLPDALIPKLEQFWGYKRRAGEGLEPDSPLFCNQSRERISKAGRSRQGSVASIPCMLYGTPRSQTCTEHPAICSLPSDSRGT